MTGEGGGDWKRVERFGHKEENQSVWEKREVVARVGTGWDRHEGAAVSERAESIVHGVAHDRLTTSMSCVSWQGRSCGCAREGETAGQKRMEQFGESKEDQPECDRGEIAEDKSGKARKTTTISHLSRKGRGGGCARGKTGSLLQAHGADEPEEGDAAGWKEGRLDYEGGKKTRSVRREEIVDLIARDRVPSRALPVTVGQEWRLAGNIWSCSVTGRKDGRIFGARTAAG